jgi:hypothetical protein
MICAARNVERTWCLTIRVVEKHLEIGVSAVNPKGSTGSHFIPNLHALHQILRLVIPDTLPWGCLHRLEIVDAKLQ